ncbi:zinc finger matrin-type protein 5-like [Sinocyclocheilus grahami]|uniref:Zinc finger matrin-type protein 5 n=1 Tax=Sinocyclocheilus grahami TaxID=75366 RepID=A0A672KHI1_SINGR|nr:PREDICTED: zinc finger matrin-type protein 5-like [Sinocyclocheilus grahami]XP_016145139.1 PREDICTED: zinc finger matrin-type protein 5-like [Sinocyclocheilus grahami]XP_016145145.1 PREDICTED: zinc finger matrin-type protein 5-like [Sinocyclocheilus grahami]
MGKRYYCDYCDRSFQDNLHNRKKHLNGVQHHRAKKSWFDNFRDAATFLNEERTKEPCRKFLQSGQCVFGTSCRFSHMTERHMKMLEQKIDDEKRQKEDPDQDGSSTERSIDEWLTRREKKLAALTSGRVLKMEEEECAENIEIPPYLLSIPDLPPSLHPPPTGGWRVTLHNEWG